AAQRIDMAAVDKIVDTDKMVDNFAAQVTEQAVGHYGPAVSSNVRKQIETVVPGLLPVIKQTIRDGVAARVKDISENASQKPFILIALALPRFVNITAAGDTATATATVHDQHVQMNLQ